MRRLYPALLIIFVLSGCSVFSSAERNMDKLKFDIHKLDEQGLYGQPDGLRALSYEFCIPGTIDNVNEVMAIDPTVVVYQNSPGRIGCGDGQYLCVGSTATDEFYQVLINLVSLKYVREIRETHFE